MQLIKQTCTLLPRRRFYLTIQSHHGFPSIYFNCKAIRGSRCVLEAADVTCGHSRRGSNYHDNANYTDDNQLNRLHSWAAFSIVAHRRQELQHRDQKSPQARWGETSGACRVTQTPTLSCAADRRTYGLQEVCLLCWLSGQLGAMSRLFVTSQLAAGRKEIEKNNDACMFVCLCLYPRFNWVSLLTAPPYSHPLRFFPVRCPSDSEVVPGRFLHSRPHYSFHFLLYIAFPDLPTPKAPRRH